MRELEGFFLHQNGAQEGAGTNTVYTETRPREGLACVFVLDVSHWYGPGAQSLAFKVETRNLLDTSWGVAATSTITGVGVYPPNVTGIKELWRVSFAVSNGTPETVIYLDLTLTWRQW